MSTNEQPDTARIEANAAAIAVNPVYENERLAELTHWGAPWANLRVVVVGMGTSGDAVTDVLASWARRSLSSTARILRRSVSASTCTLTHTATLRVCSVPSTCVHYPPWTVRNPSL